MKKRLLIFTLFLSFFSLQSQSLISESKLWSEVRFGTEYGGPYKSSYVKMAGDTLISDIKYTRAYRSADSLHASWSLQGFIREVDTGTVFFREKSRDYEVLLYDFGVEENDSIKILNGAFPYLYVDSVRIKPFGIFQEDKKHIYFTSYPNSNWNLDVWIEGVGGSIGVLTEPSFYEILGEVRSLLCFIENDSLKYSSYFNECYVSGIHLSIDQKIPTREIELIRTNDELILKADRVFNGVSLVNVFDVNGSLVFQRKFYNTNTFHLDVRSLNNGLYIYQLQSEGSARSGKFIIY